MGFDAILLGWPFTIEPGSCFGTVCLERLAPAFGRDVVTESAFERLSGACAASGLSFYVDLVCMEAGRGGLVHALEASRSDPRHHLDPRRRHDDQEKILRSVCFWRGYLERWRGAGVAGIRCHDASLAPVAFWHDLLDGLDLTAIGWTSGCSRNQTRALACAFDFVTSSAAWWDGRARWLVEEFEALKPLSRILAFPEDPFGQRLAGHTASAELAARYRLVLAVAATLSDAFLMPMGFEYAMRDAFMDQNLSRQSFDLARANAPFDLSEEIARLNGESAEILHLEPLTGPGASATSICAQGKDGQRLLVFNPDTLGPVSLSVHTAAAQLGLRVSDPAPDLLPPGGFAALHLAPAVPISLPCPAVAPAIHRPRLVIEQVTPTIDGGRFAVKRCAGDVVAVEADIFADGHQKLAAELRWRTADKSTWCRVRMMPTVNDRWQASFPLLRIGRHEFLVEAWWDHFGTFRRDLEKKYTAGQPMASEVREGYALLAAAQEAATNPARVVIRDHLRRLEAAERAGDANGVAILLSPELESAMAETELRPFATGSEQIYAVEADRVAAHYASWYELFPRSVTEDPRRHGTFRDVIERLPAIRDMGFDVVYFPPIHPIGRTHRKGRNNSLTAAPDDPGSPYAIGSEAGGHEAIHPELGTRDDFRALLQAAADHGLEIALDFAIQCSPDHPWLKQHRDWFEWRSDGTIKCAENPPKIYEDIVNVDFYGKGAIPELWLALRDVVSGWVAEGVRLFRVDNPHTKPLPFWEWLIADIRSRDPGVIFLAEAFTRPKLMYRLGKIGFSQSYTYFTWRNEKNELRDYIEELNRPPARDIFRPHLFVNTPDINPYFLQRSGRPGFLIRAALAATLSGLWGIYSGFELCEAAPLPGKEEYLDSEKYEIKPRDFSAPGNIVSEITKLNAIRRAYPALQTHLGVTFYNAFDDSVLYYGKRLPDELEMVLVAVSLDPQVAHHTAIEIPLWEFGLPDHAIIHVEDLLRDRVFSLTGKMQDIHLDPTDLPYVIWRIWPTGGAA
jgi:starch synthase (maltosyl-transferring)